MFRIVDEFGEDIQFLRLGNSKRRANTTVIWTFSMRSIWSEFGHA